MEDKLKDKLAIAAKEKLATANKEKLIQAERKRKAAMFAAMLKSSQQDQQLQQQTAAQRAQAAVQAGGEDPAAGIQPPAMKGNNPACRKQEGISVEFQPPTFRQQFMLHSELV